MAVQIFLPLVLLGIPACFLLCAVLRFGSKTGMYLRWRFSHESPQFPIGYMAKERRWLLWQRLSNISTVTLTNFQSVEHQPTSPRSAAMMMAGLSQPRLAADDLEELDDFIDGLMTDTGEIRPSIRPTIEWDLMSPPPASSTAPLGSCPGICESDGMAVAPFPNGAVCAYMPPNAARCAYAPPTIGVQALPRSSTGGKAACSSSSRQRLEPPAGLQLGNIESANVDMSI